MIAERGITGLHLSMSHDAGFATAFVVAESDAGRRGRAASDGTPTSAGHEREHGLREADGVAEASA